MIRTAIAVAALVGMTASTATSAQTTADEAPTAHVRYTDLDLSQPDDMKLLHHRVAMAVNTVCPIPVARSEEHTSELQSLMRISYAVFCLKKKNSQLQHTTITNHVHTIS